jgi:hypothetical protein
MDSDGVIILRLTHTGVYADGRPNKGSVTLYDLDEPTIQKNRPRFIPIPVNSTVDIPMSTRTFISWSKGSIYTFVKQGLLRAEILFQLRDKQNCGGPDGTGQSLRPGVLNAERQGNLLRLILPDNVVPTILDSMGFLRDEPVEIRGLSGGFSKLNGKYTISSVFPGQGLAGAEVGSYLIELPSLGPDIPPATLNNVKVCLTKGRVVVELSSGGNIGGLGTNVFGYIGGQALPSTATGGGVAPHSSTHISGGSDEIEGDLLDIGFIPTNYVRTPTAPATQVDELTSHLAGIDQALGTVVLHSSTHISGGSDEIEGDLLNIDFVPTNYVRTPTAPATQVEELTSHLAGIDQFLGTVTPTPGPQDAFFTYDVQGQLVQVDYEDLSVKTLSYNVQGQLITVVYLGVTKTLNYNPDGTLASVIVT